MHISHDHLLHTFTELKQKEIIFFSNNLHRVANSSYGIFLPTFHSLWSFSVQNFVKKSFFVYFILISKRFYPFFKVSWMRKRDLHILTSNNFLYTGDQRFSVIQPQDTDEWNLKIEYAQPKDAGTYECQVRNDFWFIFQIYVIQLQIPLMSLIPHFVGQYWAENQLCRKFRCRK